MKNEDQPGRQPTPFEELVGECASEQFLEEVDAAILDVPPDALKDVNLDDWFYRTLAENSVQSRRKRRAKRRAGPAHRRVLAASACVAALLLLAGVAALIRMQPSGDRLEWKLKPGEYVERQLLPDIYMAATVDAPAAKAEYPAEVRIELLGLDSKAVESVLIPGQPVRQVLQQPSGDDDLYDVRYENGATLLVNRNRLLYKSQLAQDIGWFLLMDGALTGSAEGDLAFASRAQADRTARTVLNALAVGGDLRLDACYAFSAERMRALNEQAVESKALQSYLDGRLTAREDWTGQDECYYMVYTVEVAGLPVDSDEYESLDAEFISSGCKITLFVSKDGVQMVDAQGLFRILSMEAARPVLPAEAALELFRQRFASVRQAYKERNEGEYNYYYQKGNNVLNRMVLQYVATPVPGDASWQALIPMWRFATPPANRASDMPIPSMCWANFDAITGEPK